MSESQEDLGLQTRVMHAADRLNETTAVSAPIWQTTTFSNDSPSQLAELGTSVHPTEFYTRYGNPTHKQVEAVMAALEGGEAALVDGGEIELEPGVAGDSLSSLCNWRILRTLSHGLQ